MTYSKGYAAEYRRINKKKIAVKNVARYALLKSQELVIIAQIHGEDTPRCRADLTSELLIVPCRGALQIDHINGGGYTENSNDRTQRVVSGRRKVLDDLRVLCELHQWCYAIIRGDSRGGSNPKEWSA